MNTSLCSHCAKTDACEWYPSETSCCWEFAPASDLARDQGALIVAGGMRVSVTDGQQMRHWRTLVKLLGGGS